MMQEVDLSKTPLSRKIYSLRADELIKQYKSLGVDISRFVTDVKEFTLFEGQDGLRTWSPYVTGDARFYKELSENNPWYYAKDKKEYEIACRYLDGSPVLEIGCGEGYFAVKWNINTYTGLDLNECAIESAKRKGLNAYCQDFLSYAHSNPESAGRVCSFQLLEHLPDPANYFRSAYTVLREGGLLITAVPAEDSFFGIIENCLNAPPHHITRWTDNCLKRYPEKFGFSLFDIVHVPIEPGHSQAFLHTLLARTFLKRSSAPLGIIEKIQRKCFAMILNRIPKNIPISEDLHISGMTVISVHRKATPFSNAR